MDEVSARAELAPSPPSEGALAATIDRSEIERALYAEDGEPALLLDVMRSGAAGTDTTRVAIAWEREDLRRALADSSSPRLTFAIDPRALNDALDDDVEAHGFREKAAVLTVAVATAAAGAASAQGAVMVETGGVGSSASAGLADSYTAMENARAELTSTVQSDATLGAGYTAAEQSRADLLAQPSGDDASLGAAYTAAEQSRSELLSQPSADDSSLGASYTAAETSRAELIGTADDFATPVSSGGGDVISAEDAGAIGAGAGMVALAIAAAAFASRHRRREGTV